MMNTLFLIFSKALLGFTRFYLVLLGFTGFCWVLLGFVVAVGRMAVLAKKNALNDLRTALQMDWLDFTEIYWVLLGFTEFYFV